MSRASLEPTITCARMDDPQGKYLNWLCHFSPGKARTAKKVLTHISWGILKKRKWGKNSHLDCDISIKSKPVITPCLLCLEKFWFLKDFAKKGYNMYYLKTTCFRKTYVWFMNISLGSTHYSVSKGQANCYLQNTCTHSLRIIKNIHRNSEFQFETGNNEI